MHTSKEYRQTAWSAIKPVLPIMLLIFLVASLPQLIFMFIQTAFGLMPPMDTDLLLSDPDAFVAAYSAFMSSSKGITYSLLNTLFTLMTIPLTLGTIGAAQRILRGEDVLVRHSLAYIPIPSARFGYRSARRSTPSGRCCWRMWWRFQCC